MTTASSKSRMAYAMHDARPMYCYEQQKDGIAKVFERTKGVKRKLDENKISEILDQIPGEAYNPSSLLALSQLAAALLLNLGGFLTVTQAPFYLLPLGWVLNALAFTAYFAIGHDCVHGTWTSSRIFNLIVGHWVFIPMAHPFRSFQYWHNKSNDIQGAPKLAEVSTASKKSKKIEAASDGEAKPSSLLAAVGLREFYTAHWNPYRFPEGERGEISVSILISFIMLSTWAGSAVYFYGILSVLNFWLIPLIIYKDFVFSYCLEFFRRGVSFHLPKFVATGIPSYRLRMASAAVVKALAGKMSKDEMAELQGERSRQIMADPTKVDAEFAALAKHSRKSENDEWNALPLIQRINWVHIVILFGTPAFMIYGWFTTALTFKTAMFCIFYYYFTGCGITAGYHRLWAHRSYRASKIIRFLLMIMGSGALQGSIKWWTSGHRIHHRYTDTDLDPYNANKGFFYSHIGWMLLLRDPSLKARVDIRDIVNDPIVKYQHKYYLLVGPFVAYLAPAILTHMAWNDFWGGLFYAGFTRLFVVHHCTFCVNSLAHYIGEHTYDDRRSPRDNILTAFLTFGEGYHNFHHEFPNDYRNGIRWYHYDPTKWLIKSFSLVGLTWELKEFPHNEVLKGKLYMRQKKLDALKATLHYPDPIQKLPEMSWEEISQRVKTGQQLCVVNQIVHDVTTFVDDHPGGRTILKAAIGDDASRRFNGLTGVYKHSKAANNLLDSFRIARLPAEVARRDSSSVGNKTD